MTNKKAFPFCGGNAFVGFNSLPIDLRGARDKGEKLVVLVILETSAAIDGAVVSRYEGNLGGRTALGTDCVIHFALGVTGVLAVAAAVLAADGLILETLFRIKLLFARREYEFRTTIFAYQSLVFEHV